MTSTDPPANTFTFTSKHRLNFWRLIMEIFLTKPRESSIYINEHHSFDLSMRKKKDISRFFSSLSLYDSQWRHLLSKMSSMLSISFCQRNVNYNELSIIKLVLCVLLLLALDIAFRTRNCAEKKFFTKTQQINPKGWRYAYSKCFTIRVILHRFGYFFVLSHLLFTCNHQLISIVQPCLQHLTYVYK